MDLKGKIEGGKYLFPIHHISLAGERRLLLRSDFCHNRDKLRGFHICGKAMFPNSCRQITEWLHRRLPIYACFRKRLGAWLTVWVSMLTQCDWMGDVWAAGSVPHLSPSQAMRWIVGPPAGPERSHPPRCNPALSMHGHICSLPALPSGKRGLIHWSMRQSQNQLVGRATELSHVKCSPRARESMARCKLFLASVSQKRGRHRWGKKIAVNNTVNNCWGTW